MTEKLSTLEKDLIRILDTNWQPGSARMIYVHATRAWTGKYDNWTQWVNHLVSTTSNTRSWLLRVFGAGQRLIYIAEKHYPNLAKTDLTSIKSIETTLMSFERAKVATVYFAGSLFDKTQNDDVLHQAALGQITQGEVLELLKQHKFGRPSADDGAGEDDASDTEEGNGEAISEPARAGAGVVTLKQVRDAAEKLGLDPADVYALLKMLRITIKKED